MLSNASKSEASARRTAASSTPVAADAFPVALLTTIDLPSCPAQRARQSLWHLSKAVRRQAFSDQIAKSAHQIEVDCTPSAYCCNVATAPKKLRTSWAPFANAPAQPRHGRIRFLHERCPQVYAGGVQVDEHGLARDPGIGVRHRDGR